MIDFLFCVCCVLFFVLFIIFMDFAYVMFKSFFGLEKKRLFFYFRFLYMAVVSLMLLTSWNPASISFCSSSILWLTLLVQSSVACSHKADSMFMYIIVLVIDLCPNRFFTCIMSLVLWYSIVAFQCRKVWKCIFNSFLSPVFSTVLFRSSTNVLFKLWLLVVKILSLVFGRVFIFPISSGDIGISLELLPFSAFI